MRMLASYVFAIGFALIVGWWVGTQVIAPGFAKAAAPFQTIR